MATTALNITPSWRNLGSDFHGWTAEKRLAKPRGLYLSSFKVMTRFVVDQIVAVPGAFPHLDGMILQTTDRLTHCEVEHAPSANSTEILPANIWMRAILVDKGMHHIEMVYAPDSFRWGC